MTDRTSKGSSSRSGDLSAGAFDPLSEMGAEAQTAGTTEESDQGGSSSTSEKVTAGVDTGMSKAAEGLDRVVETVRGKTEGMGDNQVTSVVNMAADRIETGAEALRSVKSDELVTNLESMIREKPLESMLVALGIGFVLSRAL